MKRSRFTDSQIIAILKQAEAGTPVPELCREHGISSTRFYIRRNGRRSHVPAEKTGRGKPSPQKDVYRVVIRAIRRQNMSFYIDHISPVLHPPGMLIIDILGDKMNFLFVIRVGGMILIMPEIKHFQ